MSKAHICTEWRRLTALAMILAVSYCASAGPLRPPSEPSSPGLDSSPSHKETIAHDDDRPLPVFPPASNTALPPSSVAPPPHPGETHDVTGQEHAKPGALLGQEPKVHHVAPVNPQDVARAKKFLEKGLAAYRKGEYDKAEDLLKQAVTIYPFLAEANLALGKIFLIRGSATLDRSLINNARLMFEMAHTLDPNLRETDLLLELFQTGTPP